MNTLTEQLNLISELIEFTLKHICHATDEDNCLCMRAMIELERRGVVTQGL